MPASTFPKTRQQYSEMGKKSWAKRTDEQKARALESMHVGNTKYFMERRKRAKALIDAAMAADPEGMRKRYEEIRQRLKRNN